MKEKLIPYGATHTCTVQAATKEMIVVLGDDDNEGYMLLGHGVKKLPKAGDKGKIVFKKGGPSGGYWQYYPATDKEVKP